MSFRRMSQRSKAAREYHVGHPGKRSKDLRLFQFLGRTSDWVAARDEGEARSFLMNYYGISERNIERNYRSICEINPNGIEFLLDTDVSDGNGPATQTAAEMMQGRVKPFLVGSTCG